eukprot:PhM_4_TR136/c0_g1_i1/m.32280
MYTSILLSAVVSAVMLLSQQKQNENDNSPPNDRTTTTKTAPLPFPASPSLTDVFESQVRYFPALIVNNSNVFIHNNNNNNNSDGGVLLLDHLLDTIGTCTQNNTSTTCHVKVVRKVSIIKNNIINNKRVAVNADGHNEENNDDVVVESWTQDMPHYNNTDTIRLLVKGYGATVVMNSAHENSALLNGFVASEAVQMFHDLNGDEQRFLSVAGVGVGANVYLTPGGGSQGFEAHFDEMTVVVLQIYGTKQWRVCTTPEVVLPRPDEKRRPRRHKSNTEINEKHYWRHITLKPPPPKPYQGARSVDMSVL